MRYMPARGGHAPGHLREMFCAFIETGEVPVEELRDPGSAGADPLRWLIGQLWNCTDIVPGMYLVDIDLRQGSTYAMAARSLMRV